MAFPANRVVVRAVKRWVATRRDELGLERGDVVEVFGISEGGELSEKRLYGQIRYVDGKR
jgi:hypothetical protein